MDEADTKAAGASAPLADTAADQPSDASQSELEAPEATPAVEEKQAAEVKAEDTAEEQLLAGKYKSPEDLEKAYKELESKFGKEASEKAELTRILNEAFVAPTEDTPQTFDEEPTANPETVKLQKDVAVTKFMLSHPDADGESIKQVLTQDPMIEQIAGYEARLEYAYLRSLSLNSSKAISQAQKEGQAQAAAKLAEKEVAKVESAKKAEPVDEDSAMLEKATGNYSQEERDAARMAIIRKNLVKL